MPARTTSPIPSVLEQLSSRPDSLTSSDVADLRRFLILVTDPRDVRGLRYPAVALLCAAGARESKASVRATEFSTGTWVGSSKSFGPILIVGFATRPSGRLSRIVCSPANTALKLPAPLAAAALTMAVG